MRNIVSFIVTVFLFAIAYAQVPNKMSYQAVIRNASNTLVVDQTVGMKISILQGSTSGSAIYVETQQAITNGNGLLSIEIGGGTLVFGDFSSINWANGLYFIKTETDPTGGSNYTITGLSQLLSVPYALHAKTADSIIGVSINTFKHYIGEEFGGGVIFHLWKDKQGIEHGLIVDKTDLSSDQDWSNLTTTEIGVTAQSLWDGLNNSKAIVTQEGHTNSAAALCLNSTNGGFDDWYLPSIHELLKLDANKFDVNASLRTISGASELKVKIGSDFAPYLSSSEYGDGYSWNIVFTNGVTDYVFKGYSGNVRAIRTF